LVEKFMATIGNDPNGRKRILFVAGDGKRKTIRLGVMSAGRAERFKEGVEELVRVAADREAIRQDTTLWLAALDPELHRRLVAVGLVRARQSATAAHLDSFLDSYITGRTDVKPNTLIGLGQARRNLVAFFGKNKRLADITAGDAEEYWRYLIGKQQLASNTARRLCGRAKQFFRFAVRKHIIRENPFIDLQSNVRSNPERLFFITADVAQKVLTACPDAQWKLIFALSRWGGLRCPSEHLALKWSDVDFENERLRVPSPKTEHIEGGEYRMIPLFPELRGPLLDVFTEAPEGSEFVITRYRDKKSNLRTHFQRIVQRAGVDACFKIYGPRARPSWRSTCRCTSCAVGSETRRQWRRSITCKSPMRTSPRRSRSCRQPARLQHRNQALGRRRPGRRRPAKRHRIRHSMPM
jgi:integrase